MKNDLHPKDYRLVVFKDETADFAFLTRSTAQSAETVVWEDGNTYPLIKIHISSASHPFYTGQEKLIDIEGRVDRFKARQAAASTRRSEVAGKAKKVATQKAKKAASVEEKSETTKKAPAKS